jgi:hypothetical protein
MQELVSEVNSRYGVIKRQDLTQYYRLVNAAKKNTFDVSETNYTSNDFDILGDDYVGKSPSDEFLNLKKSLDDPKVDGNTKLARLTDYKIVKEFRDRITNVYTNPAVLAPGGGPTPLVDRVRLLKKTLSLKTDSNEKYDMIMKAIEESNDSSQVPKDVLVAFHEMVIAPTRAAYALYESSKVLIDTLTASVLLARNGGLTTGALPMGVLATPIRVNSIDTTWDNVLTQNLAAIIDNATQAAGGGRASRAFKLCNHVCEVNNILTRIGAAGVVPAAAGSPAYIQSVIMESLNRMSSMNKYIKVDVSSTGRITVDLSELQKTLEMLIAQTKFMIDKFTGVIPTPFIKSMMDVTKQGTIYWLEQEALVGFFNKTERRGYETMGSAYNIELFNKALPMISDIIKLQSDTSLVASLIGMNRIQIIGALTTTYSDALPIVKTAFKAYNTTKKQYVSMDGPYGNANDQSRIVFSNAICNVNKNQILGDGQHGVIQKFNSLLKNYLNDLYDQQSNKIYTKAFANFAGSSAVSALDGNCIPDFAYKAEGVFPISFNTHYQVPRDQTVISATLAFSMRVMMTRVNPITGIKIHEHMSLSDVGPYMMDRYRAFIPMYKRLFTTFLDQCKLQRKIIQHLVLIGDIPAAGAIPGVGLVPTLTILNGTPALLSVFPTNGDAPTEVETFVSAFNSLVTGNTPDIVRSAILAQYDEVINCVGALLQDVNTVHKELLETDDASPMFFDTRKDFTKNFMNSNKALPFAPASTLALAFAPSINNGGIQPFYSRSNIYNSKFAYGIRSLINSGFKINLTNAPFMKEVLNTFNGVSSMRNKVEEKKLNDVLGLYGDVVNVLLDMRWYGGVALNNNDFLQSPLVLGVGIPAPAPLFQMVPANVSKSIAIAESTSIIDGKNTIYEFLKAYAVAPVAGPAAAAPANPRTPAIMGNLVDHMIMPINIHALMRDVPLNQLYMYSLTFDSMIPSLVAGRVDNQLPIEFIREVLENPYKPFAVTAPAAAGPLTDIRYGDNAATTINPHAIAGNANGIFPRFFKDILLMQLTKEGRNHTAGMAARVQSLMNTKIYHNMLFLTFVQWAIQQKIKMETEFINTRVIDRNVVSDTVTLDHTSTNDVVNEQLFEF